MGKLDRLEAIQTIINRGVKRLRIYKSNLEMMSDISDLRSAEMWQRDINDLKRGLDRLRIAFNNELENLKYRG